MFCPIQIFLPLKLPLGEISIKTHTHITWITWWFLFLIMSSFQLNFVNMPFHKNTQPKHEQKQFVMAHDVITQFSVNVCVESILCREKWQIMFLKVQFLFLYSVKGRRGYLWTNIFMMLIILLSCVPCLKPCVDNFYLVRSCHLIKISWIEERRIYLVRGERFVKW